MAIVQGIGYPDASRSHFRAMDIWHTCEPDVVGLKGWLGQATQELDPKHENVLTTVSFGRGLPRALACPDVPITSVGDLETYGLLAGITDVGQRNEALGIFQDMYGPAIGTGPRVGLPGADGLGRDQRRGDPERGCSRLHVRRGIRPEPDSQEPQRRGQGALCGPGHTDLLHPSTPDTIPTRDRVRSTRGF